MTDLPALIERLEKLRVGDVQNLPSGIWVEQDGAIHHISSIMLDAQNALRARIEG